MKRILFVCAMLVVSQQMGRSAIWIACQGNESVGGGGLNYEYVLQNAVGNPPELITSFSIATDDLNVAAYTQITQPAGWVFAGIIGGGGPGVATGVKTAHGAISQGNVNASAGTLLWTISGGTTMLPNTTLGIFGFNNSNAAEDGEWNAPGNPTGGAANWAVAVAGPIGVYTTGPVHVPVPEPASTAMVVAGTLLLIPIYRRWRSAK